MRMWGEKSGPCMQFLHAAFAFGAFIAPLITKPFIQDIPNKDDDHDTSLTFNVSCNNALINIREAMLCNDDVASVGCACVDAITDACNKTVTDTIIIYYGTPSDASNCTVFSKRDNSLAGLTG